jgi:signal transduction histidine kinase/DNA-binding response OmpR family regulator/CHASE3 domain sensor protein
MRQNSAPRSALLAMLIAAAAVLVLAGLGWVYARQAVEAAQYVNHTHEVKVVIRDLESSLYQAEAGQRAFLATRNTNYRNERNAALVSLEKGLRDLERLTADNATQANRAAELARELGKRVAIYRQSDGLLMQGTKFSTEQRIDLGVQVLSNIRPLIDQLAREENQLLAQRETVQAERTRTTVLIFAAAFALVLILMPLALWRVMRDVKARRAAEELVASERTYDVAHARALTLYNAENNRQAVLDGTLALLAENPLFPVGAFYAYDEWGGCLRLAASRATPADIKPVVRFDEGPIGVAAREGKSVYLEDFDNTHGLRIETGLAALRPASVLVCPVSYQGRLLGALTLGASTRLGERDQEFVRRVGAQLAVALHNLGQLEEMSLLADQLRSRGEDIQRKNAELERASRMKSEFLANMSHELRTPLNAIIGFSEIMKDGLTGELTPEQREYMADIYGSGRHLLSLINDILDLSKVESGHVMLELEEADPETLAASALSVLRERAASARVRFSAHASPAIGRALLDVRKAKQMVYNLVSNSLKFTPEGGSVTLTIDRVPAADVRSVITEPGTRVFAPGDAVCDEFLELRVTDTGIGIAPQDLAQLFQAFVQIDSSLSRQYAGTGLGLTLVKRLAELHGGGLMVKSSEGEGSVFVVWLPWRDAQQASARPMAVAHAGNGAARPQPAAGDEGQDAPLVLVVEDEPRAAQLMRVQLESEGYRVVVVGTAEEGLRKAAELRPTAVVLDIVLPGMDGWDMLARLKQHPDTHHVPVVIVSITDQAQRGFALGAAQVLVKPVTQSDLLAALSAAGLDEPHGGARVLVVDDDPKAVALVSKHLAVAGYTPVGAYGGQEALDIVRNAAPALIVLDLMMPQVSGFDVVQGLREHPDTAGIPVIVLTAKLLTQDDRSQLSGKVQRVMEKTHFNSIGLVAEVKRALVGREPRAWH